MMRLAVSFAFGRHIGRIPSRLPLAPRVMGGLRGRVGHRTLAAQFMVASFAVLVLSGLIVGAWVSDQIERSVLTRTAGIAALYVESFIEPHLQPLAHVDALEARDIAALDRLVADTPLGERVVAFRVWSLDSTVRYSPNHELIGRRFPTNPELRRAAEGEVVADLSSLTAPENEYERRRWNRLLEVYVPVRERGGAPIIAVAEFYQLPNALESDLTAARLRSWGVVAGTMLAAYLGLAGIVKRGSDTIGRQQAALRRQVGELSRLLEQNARLHQRVRQAAGRTTTLNEQALRRISADLHDGPAQALGLALLRLDTLAQSHTGALTDQAGDFAIVRSALKDALAEIRAIAAGLRAPAFADQNVAEVAERVVRDHERRSGGPVALNLGPLPANVPLPVKIALFRSLQEALSNATRHAAGATITVRLEAEHGWLCVAVADEGPGFVALDASGRAGGLGLIGMRERAELLGGYFRVDSTPGKGTTVRAGWPLGDADEPDERHP